MISLFIEKGILRKQFQAVKETPGTTCIDCSDIIRRCVFVPYAGDGVCGFLSPVWRHYQHDWQSQGHVVCNFLFAWLVVKYSDGSVWWAACGGVHCVFYCCCCFFLAALKTCLASQSIFREKHRSSTLLYKMFRMFSTPWCSTHGLFQKETSNKYAIAMKSLDGYFSAQINIPFERQAGKARTVRHRRSMHDDIISFITELWIWRC